MHFNAWIAESSKSLSTREDLRNPLRRAKSTGKGSKISSQAQSPESPGTGKGASKKSAAAQKRQRQPKVVDGEGKSIARPTRKAKPAVQPNQEAQHDADSTSVAAESTAAGKLGNEEVLETYAGPPQQPESQVSVQNAGAHEGEGKIPPIREGAAASSGENGTAEAPQENRSMAKQASEESLAAGSDVTELAADGGAIPDRWQEANR